MTILNELKAALAAATPGEWRRNGNMIYAGLRFGDEGFDPTKTQFERIADVADRDQFNYDKQLRSADNAHLIPLMKNNLPALIECVEALREFVTDVQAAHSEDTTSCLGGEWYDLALTYSKAVDALAKLKEQS